MTYASALAFTLALATSPLAFAATPMEGMDMKPAAQGNPSNQTPKPVAAEVRKVDLDTGKITLKHGDINNLGMGAMTMTFAVKDRASLKNFKAGDNVSARFDWVNGQPTVVEMHRQ